MIVTETYLKNAEKLKKIVNNTFSLSEKSYEEFCSYVDDPTKVLNDNAKSLFETFKDDVVDYRIKLDTEKMLKAETPSEILLSLEMLNDILYEEYPQYRKIDNNCNISSELLIQNKFILFGQERKLWRFLKAEAPKMAEIMFKENIKKIGSGTHAFCLGPIIYAISVYKYHLGLRQTSLRTKIVKFEEKIANEFTNISELTIAISMAIDILSDIVGAKNIRNPDGYQAYLSFNFFDWFLASTGEDWGSCIGHDSEMCYSLGLTGLFSCPDWGMVFIAKKENKKIYGIEVPHIVTRSWAVYGDNENYNLVNWYPHDIRGKVSADKKFYDDKITLSYNDWKGSSSEIKGASWYKPFYLKDGTVPFIYADCYSIKPSKSNNSVRIDMNGVKCGLPCIEKYTDCGEDKFRYGGSLESICENLRNVDITIENLISDGNDAIDSSESDYDSNYCDFCGHRTSEDTTYIRGIGEVCENCLNNDSDFYYCEDCNEWHHNNISPYTEIYGSYVCARCRDEYYTLCEECNEWYWKNDLKEVNGRLLCEDCIDELKESGKIKECGQCGKYLPVDEIATIVGKNHSTNICYDCVEIKNFCSKHEIFYDKNLKGCPICEEAKNKQKEKVS